MNERDTWEEIIQSKLADFEADTDQRSWQAIADRLPAGKRMNMSRRWYYAAAAIAIFLLIGGGLFYFYDPNEESFQFSVFSFQVGKKGGTGGEEGSSQFSVFSFQEKEKEKEDIGDMEETEEVGEKGEERERVTLRTLRSDLVATVTTSKQSFRDAPLASLTPTPSVSPISPISTVSPLSLPLNAHHFENIPPVQKNRKSGRRWSFGAGGGSYGVGTNGGALAYNSAANLSYASAAANDGGWYLNTPAKRNDYIVRLLSNSSHAISEANTSIPKVGITHKRPISFGIGVGYALNDRWSLQSGLTYTYLSSEWSTVLDYQGKSRQHLHFVGIPLGINYTIAEWNKLRFYTTAGALAEMNVGGTIKTDYYYFADEAVKTEKESVRMKELQWSVNARVGATYPVIKFINAYVEGGANYYFDNKSSIETIRSDKPFHVSLQAGIRFGF